MASGSRRELSHSERRENQKAFGWNQPAGIAAGVHPSD